MDRFDLEENINTCCNILNDLRMIVDDMEDDHIDKKRIEAVIELYELKFTCLWNTFSELIDTHQFRGSLDE